MKKQLGTGIVFLLLCAATVAAMSSTVFYGPVATMPEEGEYPGFFPDALYETHEKTLLSCMVFTDRGIQPWDSSFSLQGKAKQQLYKQGGTKAEEFEVFTLRTSIGDVVDLAVNKGMQSAKDIDYPCVDSQNVHVCVAPSYPLYSSDKGRISEIYPLLPDSNLVSTTFKKADFIINAFAKTMIDL
jgi:hypothetical protein